LLHDDSQTYLENNTAGHAALPHIIENNRILLWLQAFCYSYRRCRETTNRSRSPE